MTLRETIRKDLEINELDQILFMIKHYCIIWSM